MSTDEFGFPRPAGFDEEPRRYRASVTPGRLLLLGLVIAALGLSAAFYEYGDRILDKLNMQLVLPRRAVMGRLQHIQKLANEGKTDEALAECERLAKVEPKLGLHLKAQVLTAAGRIQDTVGVFTQILHIDPFDAIALNGRAYNRALCRIELPDAEKDIHRALEIRGHDPSFVDTRGYIHYLLGRPKLALADFNAVLNVPLAADNSLGDVGLGEVHFHRGLVYKQLGENELAEKDFERAKQLGFKITDYPQPIVAPPTKEKGNSRTKRVG